jgi:hypothetical protein
VTEPYRDATEHLRDELRRVWLRVEYEVRLARARDGGQDTGTEALLEEWLAVHRQVEARIAATIDSDLRTPLIELIRVFDLTARQWSALMFALLPEADPELVTAYRHLAQDPGCRGLEGRLLAQLVYDTPQARALMARDLSAMSPLVRFRLLEVAPPGPQSESLMLRRIRAAPRLAYLLDGTRPALDPELADLAELRGGDPSGELPDETVAKAIAAMRSPEVVLAVQGQRGIGKKLLLTIAASHWGQQLLVIDTRRLAAQPPMAQPMLVRAIVRELALLDALPVFADLDDAYEGEGDALPACFDQLLAVWYGPLALTINRERMPRINQRPLVHLSLEVPSLDARARMWREVVPTLGVEAARGLSGRFAIPGGVIVAAAQAALAERLPEAGPPDASALDRAVAGQLHQRITRLGKKLDTPFDLDDLIVDDDTRTALLEIVGAAGSRRQIRDQFKLRGAQGISVLFSGHPGVGKTMSATVLARRLGLDIYEIDLSQVVSKWLGETEKNLSDVFDAAEPGHVVLLFNEADSLFGKRTSDVKSSNDRYANMETNYLLQRLERFGGVAILTTNLTSAIDQAFKRRFTYDVFFSFPSPDMRAQLWQRALPAFGRDASIDFEDLAEKFELSGGFIKVACERAAYVAGAKGSMIDDSLLRATIERMYRERGKLSTVGPLE